MKKLAFAALISLAPIFTLFAQRTLRGKISEAMTGLPLPGATVRTVGYDARAISDKNGNYVLELPKMATELSVNHPAFREKRAKISGLSTQNFSLSADISLFKVKGTVLDASNGKPIPGAKLEYLRTKSVHQTDEKGQFSVSVAARSSVFKISALGFQTLTRTLESGENSTIRLDPEPKNKTVSTPPVVVATPSKKPSNTTSAQPKVPEIRQKRPETASLNPSPELKETPAEKASSSADTVLPWWQQAQYMVPILVALIGGLFSLLQTWLSRK